MSKPRHVNNDFSEYMDSTGRVLILCVLHELDPNSTEGLQAVTTIYGLSVCRKHLDAIVEQTSDGYSLKEIVTDVKRGNG